MYTVDVVEVADDENKWPNKTQFDFYSLQMVPRTIEYFSMNSYWNVGVFRLKINFLFRFVLLMGRTIEKTQLHEAVLRYTISESTANTNHL